MLFFHEPYGCCQIASDSVTSPSCPVGDDHAANAVEIVAVERTAITLQPLPQEEVGQVAS